jgi:hypothetical protein
MMLIQHPIPPVVWSRLLQASGLLCDAVTRHVSHGTTRDAVCMCQQEQQSHATAIFKEPERTRGMHRERCMPATSWETRTKCGSCLPSAMHRCVIGTRMHANPLRTKPIRQCNDSTLDYATTCGWWHAPCMGHNSTQLTVIYIHNLRMTGGNPPSYCWVANHTADASGMHTPLVQLLASQDLVISSTHSQPATV